MPYHEAILATIERECRARRDCPILEAVKAALSEEERDGLMAECWEDNYIQVVDGLPGAGKTFLQHCVLRWCVREGHGKPLFLYLTANAVSRARAVFGANVDVDTFHAALGDGSAYTSNDAVLVTYPLVCIDECFQLSEQLFDHLTRMFDSAGRVPALLLCGDKAQMGSPSGRSAFHSLRWARRTRTVTLTYSSKHGQRFRDQSWVGPLNRMRYSRPTSIVDGYKIRDITYKHRAWAKGDSSYGGGGASDSDRTSGDHYTCMRSQRLQAYERFGRRGIVRSGAAA